MYFIVANDSFPSNAYYNSLHISVHALVPILVMYYNYNLKPEPEIYRHLCCEWLNFSKTSYLDVLGDSFWPDWFERKNSLKKRLHDFLRLKGKET